MEKLVDGNKVQEILTGLAEGLEDIIERASDEIYKLPVIEPRTGSWIGVDDEPCEVWECDRCGHIVEVDATFTLPNYCENCGARMTEEGDGRIKTLSVSDSRRADGFIDYQRSILLQRNIHALYEKGLCLFPCELRGCLL